MSRTPNYHMNPYQGGMQPRNSGFSPYRDRNRSSMGPPDGQRHGYYSPQHGDSPMGGGPEMMQRPYFPQQQQQHNSSPFSPPSFYQSPYQQSPVSATPRDRGGQGRGSFQRRDSRGRGGRGRGGWEGEHFTPSGHQQFHNRRRFSGGSPYQRGQHGDGGSMIERYYKPSMLEDPWRHLVAKQSASAGS